MNHESSYSLWPLVLMLARRDPGIDRLSHESGHLLHTLLGWKGDPHFDLFHVLSYALIGETKGDEPCEL